MSYRPDMLLPVAKGGASASPGIPADIRLIFIWTPGAQIPTDDVNGLKLFAQEGGRVVVIGEYGDFMGTEGIAAENRLLLDLGAQLTNEGATLVQGEYAQAEGTHQLVTGVPKDLYELRVCHDTRTQ